MQPPQPPPAKPLLAACGHRAMTRAETWASLDLLSTWTLSTKAAAPRLVIAVVHRRLAAGAGQHAARRDVDADEGSTRWGGESPAGPAAAPGHQVAR
jgi:hypothetical protein